MHAIGNLASIRNQPSVHPTVRPNQVLSPRWLEVVLFTLPKLRTLRLPALLELRKLSYEGVLLSDALSRWVMSSAEPAAARSFLERPPRAALRRSDAVDWRAVEG